MSSVNAVSKAEACLLANRVETVSHHAAIETVVQLLKNDSVKLVSDGKKKELFRIYADVELKGHYLGDCSGFSASQQFNLEQFSAYVNQISQFKKNKIVVNLREESYVFLKLSSGEVMTVRVLGQHLDDANQGKTVKEIEEDETRTVEKIQKIASVTIYEKRKKQDGMTEIFSGSISRVFTEKELCETLGVRSIRLAGGDHKALPVSVIDQIVSLCDEDVWPHFHCCGGKGRSSQAAAILAILKWGPDKTLDEIFNELEKKGNKSLRNKKEDEDVRLDPLFWKSFYNFARSEERIKHKMSWSDWLNTQKSLC